MSCLHVQVAPTTVKHIIKLFQLGCYNSNHFFRVDAGFVAQTADVIGGRLVPLSDEQEQEAQVQKLLSISVGALLLTPDACQVSLHSSCPVPLCIVHVQCLRRLCVIQCHCVCST